MSHGASYVADLLEQRFDLHRTQGTNTGTLAPLSAAADEQALDVHRQRLDAIRTRLGEDPQAVLHAFRELLHAADLTYADLDEYLRTWETATGDPDAFSMAVATDLEMSGLGDWFARVRAYLHAPKDVSAADKQILGELAERYVLPADLDVNPNLRRFERYDPAWVPLLDEHLAEQRGTWPNLEPFRYHDRAPSRSSYVYPSNLPYGDGGIRLALMADFGTGYYHSLAIARQLEAWKYPYVFHLGDVYYAGRASEFKDWFEKPLENVVQHSRLFGLPENHELFSGGTFYRRYFDGLLASHRGQQEGSYFCVPFQHHQIIGIDVNWHGRQTFLDPKCRDWLSARIAESNGRTNILLTGSGPFDYPSKDRAALLGHLWEFVRHGQIHLWFWGNDHYCALFDRHATLAPFIGSCIGHGGYPGSRTKPDQPCWTAPLWVEDEPRFPAWTKLRQDAGNNGWCQATLLADGSVELLYVDWLSAKRCRVTLARRGDVLVPAGPHPFAGRGSKAYVPELHRPA